jgi:hypothetical protein
VAADRRCSQRRPAEPGLLTTGDAGVPGANPRWAVLRARLRRWGAAAGVALERLGRLWEPRRDAGLPSRDSSDAADRSIGPRPHAATPDSHLIVAVFPSRIAALHPPMDRGMGAAALETERLFFRLEFIELAGYPNVLGLGSQRLGLRLSLR